MTTQRRRIQTRIIAACAVFAAAYGMLALNASSSRGDSGPTMAVTAAPPAGREQATFAAGCFWSMEAIFKELKGVEKVEPGYSGGTRPHPSYEQVETGGTGYAETVNITYNPKVISYQKLLTVLLTERDPTSIDRQGNDEGPQYRSVIFYRNGAQKREAEQALQQAEQTHLWPRRIVTEVVPFKQFWRAEAYHLNYYALHPQEPYCAGVIAPELASFRTHYHADLKSAYDH